ncbi:thiosulfate sulfurtransferase GlpE [Alteromonadaceae bacterium M269]|nr:thiosulfate sulfurtransferase GlpE [Alteromonadaceae bacterium M269]
MSHEVVLKHLNVQEAAELIKNNDVCVVDNRDVNSFHVRHIEGATHLSNENVQQFLAQTSKSVPIICCCYHGNSSQQVGHFLIQQGFSEVYNLDGGFEAWRQVFPVSDFND